LLHDGGGASGALGGRALLETGRIYRTDGIHGAAKLADGMQSFIMSTRLTHSGTLALGDQTFRTERNPRPRSTLAGRTATRELLAEQRAVRVEWRQL
jgi:hypothetical protein